MKTMQLWKVQKIAGIDSSDFNEIIGGPDPLSGLIMVGTTFVILIVAMVIMLIRAIVKKAITYKTDYDLTV